METSGQAQACQATPEEIAAERRRCWSPPCQRRAFFEDWGGWRWCWKHFYRELQQSDHKWFELKKVRIIL